MEATEVPPALSHRLLSIPEDVAVVFSRAATAEVSVVIAARHVRTGSPSALAPAGCDAIAATLDATHVLTVPVIYREEMVGRLYVTSRRSRFQATDIDLLAQVFRHVMPVIDNVRLVDHLASDAAEFERKRIARDLHDSIIQSYIGIELAVSGVQMRAATGLPVAESLAQIERLVNNEIRDARRYVSNLEATGPRMDALASSLGRFAAKFSEATAIQVRLDIGANVVVSDRLAAEAFQIAEEELSNIRRHTLARSATIRVAQTDGDLTVTAENPRDPAGPVPSFVPRSVTARATALGGRVTVDTHRADTTVVTAHIPL